MVIFSTYVAIVCGYVVFNRAVTRAVNNLTAPDGNTSDAVDVRQELDLRIGLSKYPFFLFVCKRNCLFERKYGCMI
jgi:hypothetical protein